MKKNYLLFILMAFVMGLSAAKAGVVAPYTEAFEGLNTSDHSFKPTGWGHIVDSYESYDDYETYYVSYSNPSTGGWDGGAYLKIGSQNIGSYYDSYDASDMLVTPALTGEVSLYVKLTSASGTLKFYTCSYASGKYTKGAEYEVTLPELSTDTWTKVTIPDVAAGTRLGICGSNVGIDDLTAASADVELSRALTITNAKWTGASSQRVDASPEGTAALTFSVTVKNSGEAALNPGDEGYSIDIINYSQSNAVVTAAPVAITQALAPGETATFDVAADIAITAYAYNRFDLRENITSTTTTGAWLELYPYAPVYSLYDENSDKLDDGATIAFGTSKTGVTRTFTIRNDGGAPLTVNAITLPEGFSYALTDPDGAAVTALPLSVAPHKRATLAITMDETVKGTRAGNILLGIDGVGDKTYPVSGTIVDPSKLFVTFDDGKFPAGTYLENGSRWSVGKNSSNTYDNCALSALTDPLTKFALPKIRIAAGETFTFEAAKRSNSSTLKVYYSPDRKTWTEVRSISDDAENEEDRFSSEKISGSSNFDNFKLKGFTAEIPEGDWYVAFASGYARVDNIFGGTLLPVADYELLADPTSLPETATVNKAYRATVIVSNVGAQAIAAGDVTAKFYMGETVAEETVLPALDLTASTTLNFSFTPHAAGTFPVKVAFEGKVTSEITTTVTVAEETVDPLQAVGTANTTQGTVPVSMNWDNTDSETIYPKDAIRLANGTAIKGIVYKGYRNETSEHTVALTIWMDNTEETNLTTTDLYPTDGMTKVYEGNWTFPTGGSAAETINMIEADFSDAPFTYTGGNLRVVVKSRTIGEYSRGNFESDNTYSNVSVYRHKDNAEPTGSMSALSSMPVAYLAVDKEATTLSGTVTDGQTKTAIEGAAVTLKSGEVEYGATTGADGSYSLKVFQDKLDYTLTVSKDGYFTEEATVSFPEGSVVKDVAMQEASGFRIEAVSYPEAAEVNSAFTVQVTALNGIAKEAGSYTAKLYVDDEAVDEAEAAALEANETKEFSFSYTPHQEGTIEAYVELAAGESVVTTEPAQIAVAAESASADKQVGTPTGRSYVGPVRFYDQSSITEIIYPKDEIGLAAGTKILSVKFKGYHYGKDITFDVKMWIANESGTTFKDGSTDGMQLIGDITYDASQNAGVPGDKITGTILNFEIPEGFVYTGENIRIVATSVGSGWVGAYFETDNTVKNAAQYKYSTTASLASLDSKSWTSTDMPVAYFGISPKKTLSGKVTDTEDAPVAGAKLTLTSGNVEYSTTSADDGTYSVDVIKYSLDYTLTATAEGYKPYTASSTVSLAEGDATLNVTLEKEPATYTITGHVTDATNGNSAGGVDIELTKDGETVYTATTDASGIYTMPDMALTTDAEWKVEYKKDSRDLFESHAITIDLSTAVDGVITVDMPLSPTSAVESLATEGLTVAGGEGCILVTAPADTLVRVYTPAGTLVRSEQVAKGKSRIDGLTPGVYIAAGKKVIVR